MIEILKDSWLENHKYAQELNQVLGADHPKAQKQWEETNKIAMEIKSINDYETKQRAEDNKGETGSINL